MTKVHGNIPRFSAIHLHLTLRLPRLILPFCCRDERWMLDADKMDSAHANSKKWMNDTQFG